jgi:alpha-N-arabinofuranosidase
MPSLELRMEGPSLRRRPAPKPPARERFDGRTLAPEWMFVRNPPLDSWSLRERPGFLRLWGGTATLRDVASPSLVCRPQPGFDLTARTRLSFAPRHPGEQAGICIRANEDFHVALLVALGDNGRELRLERTTRGRTMTLGRRPLAPGPVTLEVQANAEAYTFGELGTVRTRSLSAETILDATGRHHFTGAVIGLYATGNGERATVPADFHWFEIA